MSAGLIAALLALVPPPPRAAADDAPRKAPSITLKTLDGKKVRLADYKGRIVVLDFWASWCAPCRATFPKLQVLADEMKAQGVEVLAVSEDEKRKELDAFLAELQPAFAVVTDPNGSAASSFKVVAIPSMYVIDRDGTIRFSHPNYSIDVLEVVRGEIAALASIPQLHNSATSN